MKVFLVDAVDWESFLEFKFQKGLQSADGEKLPLEFFPRIF